MPQYRWNVPKDSVPFEQRQQVAVACTDIHCGTTGAPRSFVHTTFIENPEEEFPTPFYLDGGNRPGRPQELKDKMLGDLLDAFTDITGVARDKVSGRIVEGSPGRMAMEGGAVLPEVGEEGPEWYAEAAN